VHLLHGPDLPAACRHDLQAFVARTGGTLVRHEIPDEDVAGLPRMGRIPPVMWYRVFLPDLLPGLDRILYLDADTLVVADPTELWDTELDSALIAAVDNVLEPEFADHPRDIGLDPGQRYFNSGVLLFNLAAMRDEDCTRRIVEHARGTPLLWPDQDALNVVLGARRVVLHPRWNCMNSMMLLPYARDVFPSEVLDAARRDPGIVHFEGPELAKPWHHLSKHPYRSAYMAHRAATPWPDIEIEGRTLVNRVLRPLPTWTTIRLLVRARTARARVASKLRSWRG
jgi:lipopolysaccharide biosynthesis glycosyltransferase